MRHQNTPLTLTLLVIAAGALRAGETEAPKPDMAERRAAQFARIDKNGDGAVTKDEFLATKAAQKNPAQSAKVFARRDKDGNGSLSKEEFVGAPAQKPQKPASGEAAAADDGDAG